MTIMTTILTMFIKDSKEMDLSDVVTALSPSRPAQVRPRRVRSRGEAARAHWATSRGGVAPLLLAVTRPVCAHCHGNEHSRALFRDATSLPAIRAIPHRRSRQRHGLDRVHRGLAVHQAFRPALTCASPHARTHARGVVVVVELAPPPLPCRRAFRRVSRATSSSAHAS